MMTNEDPEYSDFEKRRSFQRFNEICTQDYIEATANELSFESKDISLKLKKLTDLSTEFDNTADIEDAPNWSYFLGRAVRFRDADLANMIADEMFTPYSQINNPIFTTKMDAICENNTKPALRAI